MQLKEFAKRQATNAPIQGSCADLIKNSYGKYRQRIRKKQLKTRLNNANS